MKDSPHPIFARESWPLDAGMKASIGDRVSGTTILAVLA
jgi:hypothetical protein